MNNNKTDFQNFFPTDNSSTSNLHYDLVAEKFLTGVQNHQRKQYHNSSSISGGLGLTGAIIQIVIGLVALVIAIFRYISAPPK